MKRVALGLLLGAAVLYAVASLLRPRHLAWGYVAAFAEAAMVGAVADWFAVVALFRHPLGLPIPRTAIIPRNKDRIGSNLARFLSTHFLSTEQVMARLQEFDLAGRLAAWLERPRQARLVATHLADLGGWVAGALDQPHTHRALVQWVQRGLGRVDVAALTGQMLAVLTQERRHQLLLDGLLFQIANMLGTESFQERVSAAIAREVRVLRLVRLDQAAAQLATRKIIIAVARILIEIAQDPQHELRLRFDELAQDWTRRLQQDPNWRQRGEQLRDELLQHPALAATVEDLVSQWLAGLRADLQTPHSRARKVLRATVQELGRRLHADAALRTWLNEQAHVAIRLLLERYRDDVAAYVEHRVHDWDATQLTAELERYVGRDLQFIRINGTVVGGLVGLTIHTVTQLLS